MYELNESIPKRLNISNLKFMEELVNFIIQYLKDRKITQAEFAGEVGVDVKTVSRWVTGKNKISLVNFFNIMNIIGIEKFNEYLKEKHLL